MSCEHKREFLLEFRNSSGRYFFPQCPNTRRATGGDNQVSSVFWICRCACCTPAVLFPLWLNTSIFFGLLTFYGVLGFHLPSLFFLCVCAHACVCTFYTGWMHPVSLGYWPFTVCLVFTCPFSFFYMCVCVCTRARVCAFSTDECIYFPWAVDFLWCAWFSLSLSFFLCVPNVSVVQLIQVRSNMYELSSWCELDLACISCSRCISSQADAS